MSNVIKMREAGGNHAFFYNAIYRAVGKLPFDCDLIAFKLYGGDAAAIVVEREHPYHRYVALSVNPETGDCWGGHYVATKEEAMEAFNAKTR